MFRKKQIDLDALTAAELEEFYRRAWHWILWRNGIWLLIVVLTLIIVFPVGLVLLVLTIAKYAYDCFDTKSQAANAAFQQGIIEKRVDETKEK